MLVDDNIGNPRVTISELDADLQISIENYTREMDLQIAIDDMRVNGYSDEEIEQYENDMRYRQPLTSDELDEALAGIQEYAEYEGISIADALAELG